MTMSSFGDGTLPKGVRSRVIRGINGLDVHVLEGGHESAGRPLALLLHGFPDLAYGWRHLIPILADAGPLPHGRLKTSADAPRGPGEGEDGEGGEVKTTGPKKQTKRHIKCLCSECGYTARTSRKWLDQVGPPHCPAHGQMEVIEDETGQPDDD